MRALDLVTNLRKRRLIVVDLLYSCISRLFDASGANKFNVDAIFTRTVYTEPKYKLFPKMSRLRLYYDGNCSLCAREIAVLRRLSPQNVGFEDIHQIEDFSGLPAKQTMLKRLHLRADSGEWYLGLDATVEVWSQTRYGIFFKLLKLPGIKLIADQIYRRWADRRYCKRYSVCNAATE